MNRASFQFPVSSFQFARLASGNRQLATGNWQLATEFHMHDLTSVPQTNPVDLYRVRDAIYAPDMLLTALVHLDLFSRLARHPPTKEEICGNLGITDRPTDVMLTLFAAMGLVGERLGVFY